MEKLTIVDGKFYKGGIAIPVEFGNKEQIDVLNKAAKIAEAFKKGGLAVEVDYLPETTYEATVSFQCICSKYLSFYTETDSDDVDHIFDGKEIGCKCGLRYSAKWKENQLVVLLNQKSIN